MGQWLKDFCRRGVLVRGIYSEFSEGIVSTRRPQPIAEAWLNPVSDFFKHLIEPEKLKIMPRF